MSGNIRSKVLRHLSNIPGWRTNRKIVVIESDDWGSIRMPSKAAFENLERSGIDLKSLDAERYNRNDSLATSSDLEDLFDVLGGFRDTIGNPAVITPIAIVANPDFDRIKKDGFTNYYYEPFTETLKRFPGCEASFSLWLEGITHRIFSPQMHGREHLNVSAWLSALQRGDKHTLLAFNEGIWGFVPDPQKLPGIDFQAAYLLSDPTEIEYHKTVINEGLDLFENLFNYRAVYFVPPNGPFNNSLNMTLYEHGIKFRSVAKLQQESMGNGKTKKSMHWLGQKEKQGVTYITRNCFFEPSQSGKDWLNSCLSDIEIAFRMKKPAIISSHRLNYIGALEPENKRNGLRQLSSLLQEILNKWPEVEFMSTEGLGKLILEKE